MAEGAPRDPAAPLRGLTREEYRRLVSRQQPKKPLVRNLWWAFAIGGTIAEVGQAILWGFTRLGLPQKEALSATAVVLVGLGALLTGLGWYDAITKLGGMGGSLPITGFANAMVAPAMEYRREGLVLGIGARLFTIAGPVLTYTLLAGFVVGFIGYFLAGWR
ncbi:mechanosensitive channel; stage V sporulation protein AC [Candidatus Hydrogenisulfobacillus filiaventi]|uniref:Mechanosensitive channel stage V sporulation protein AC n=1 Tax=Candidatus Hydrogenisulfobacillus filiaventi TaxID=2707344 RepID=A0A6F8ZFN6_9FIRM|nr:SpoVA/SpoVAEb family sporulation membrane protein [Bacillota bacterium]CAB1128691.1 mechanosensitive channel; stage V sporulation protein AC [Candidatus Hydrogenisulfobacillus filiaventi]